MANAAPSTGDAINLTDTNVRATLTVEFEQTVTGSEPFYNAFTGTISPVQTIETPDKHFSVHGEFTQNGAFAFDLVSLDAPEDSEDAVHTARIRNGTPTLLNDEGQMVGSGVSLHLALGTESSDPLDALGGIVLDQLPAAGSSSARGGGSASVTSVTATGGFAVVDLVMHQGAGIARSAGTVGFFEPAITEFTRGFSCRILGQYQCLAVGNALSVFRSTSLISALSSPGMQDLRPNSLAIQQVNAGTETFPRFGIKNSISDYFTIYQVAGDALFPANEGRRMKVIAASAFALSLAVAVVGTIVAVLTPWSIPGAVRAYRAVAIIGGLDVLWKALTVGFATSDGVVTTSSQTYPNATLNRSSLDPSSHTAQIDGLQSARDIQAMLRDGLNVQSRQ